MTEDKGETNRSKILWWGIVTAILVIVLVIGYAVAQRYFEWPFSRAQLNEAGVFGDSFGILTSLFSGLAFVGIVFTILLQREDLNLQQQTLKETRDELRNQVEATKHQNFESTFFQMLRLHNDIVSTIDFPTGGNPITGRACFETFYKRLEVIYHNRPQLRADKSEEEYLAVCFDEFWKSDGHHLGHYFRYLYNVLNYLKNCGVEDRKFYSNLVRAQLSNFELKILFYNCLSPYGSAKFKPIAEEFALFDNLPVEELLLMQHTDFYEPTAFG